ncbi:hypothetical protein [Stenotrophomonas indicatrix]|uniref:hypothetical protein n=1 Tax=Stenotrophomonas indicatrix TaxID=2045451 RepID=UPI001AA12272|nr:hypothetical protein [Stenotrophomonas indicatrix]MBO1748925.1 hypothetical protein [Stenotrophomonas indicatrix]
MAAKTPRPCRKCGGAKGHRSTLVHMWYCNPCAEISRREYFSKHRVAWCGQCLVPWECVECKRRKAERAQEFIKNRKRRRDADWYFRPDGAERWWQHKCHSMVSSAVKRGLIPSLKGGGYACVDCGSKAEEYDHRDYSRPFDVEPVCRACNRKRGTAKWPTADQFKFSALVDLAERHAPTREAA